MFYDLDNSPKNLLRNFKCLFDLTNRVKDNDKEKYVHNGYGIAFNEKGSWSFIDNFSINIVTFGVDNSSSSHTDNLKMIF